MYQLSRKDRRWILEFHKSLIRVGLRLSIVGFTCFFKVMQKRLMQFVQLVSPENNLTVMVSSEQKLRSHFGWDKNWGRNERHEREEFIIAQPNIWNCRIA